MLGATGEIVDIPKVISLASAQGDRVGVLMLAPGAGNGAGDCIFMLSPTSSAGIDSDMGLVVSELKVTGEHRYSVTALNDGVRLIVLPEGMPKVEFHLNHEFKGNVLTEFGGAIKCIGSAEPLRSSA